MSVPKNILDEIMKLSSSSRVELVDYLLKSLDVPDKEIDSIWKDEVERRINEYEKGNLKALTIEEVLAKYK